MRFRSVLLLCGVAGLILAAESGNDLFQKGLSKERAEGDARGAIQIYQRVAAMPGVDRKLAAEALFRIAECQQSIGNFEARKTYQRIVKDFGDQRDVAGRAGDRLAKLEAVAMPVATELGTRRVWVPPSHNLAAGNISADGRYFSYAEYFSGGDLAVRDLVSGESRHLTHKGSFQDSSEYASTSIISPDQKRIAYTWKTTNRYELRVIDWDGSNQKTVYANPEGSWVGPAAWSPNGREILAQIETRSRTKQLAWIGVPGESSRVLKTFPWQVLGEVKAVSPNGRYIAYDASTNESKNRTIFLLASDGSSETAVTDNSAVDEVIGWMPDGKALLFATDRTGGRELWALPLLNGKTQGKPFVVKPDLGNFNPLGVSRDGSLFYSRIITEGQAYTSSIDWSTGKMASPVPIARGVVPELGADWSPDGKQIAYVAHQGTELNRRFIVVHSVETGEDRIVRPKQELSIFVNGGYLWSPDGSSFMVTGADANRRQGAYNIDLTTGDVRMLVQREGTVQQPQWLPDGKQILYVLRQTGPDRAGVFIRNLETGSDREVPLGIPDLSRVSVAVSPDGQQLAFAPGDNNRYHTLFIMSLSDGVRRQVYEVGADGSLLVGGWSRDSQQVVLLRALRDAWIPSWISAKGGQPHAIETSLEAFRVHPDGKRVVSVKRDLRTEFWKLQNISAVLHP